MCIYIHRSALMLEQRRNALTRVDAHGLELVVVKPKMQQEHALHTTLMEDVNQMTSVGSNVHPNARRIEIEDVLGMVKHV